MVNGGLGMMIRGGLEVRCRSANRPWEPQEIRDVRRITG